MTAPVVALVGPPFAGTSSLAAALRKQMPDVTVVEGNAGDVVVFAASATATMAESDRALLSRAAPAVAALTKVDAHRTWRDVLVANRSATPDCRLEWVPVAAAPDLGGEPDLGDLVPRLRALLAAGAPRTTRTASSARIQAQRTRVRLVQWVRGRSADAVHRWRADAARVRRRDVAAFEAGIRAAADALLADVDAMVEREVTHLAIGRVVAHDLPDVRLPMPPHASRRAENQLAAVLGAGFGLGVALATGRLVSELADTGVLAAVAGVVVGLAVTAWVVAVRGTLYVRAVLDRWVTEVGGTVRSQGEALVVTRFLAVDAALLDARNGTQIRPAREEPEGSATRSAFLNRSCERSDILPIYRG